MTLIGYTMMYGHAVSMQLVRDVALAEEADVALTVISDIASPGSRRAVSFPYPCSTLGAAVQATRHIP